MEKDRKIPKSDNLFGAVLILLASLFGVMQGVLVKQLVGLHPTQILFFKSSIGILLLFILSPSFRYMIVVKDFRAHLLKGISGFLGNIFSISALMVLSLMDCISIAMSSAIFTSIGGVLIYKEKPKAMIWYSLFLCSIGVIIIATPSFVVDYLPKIIINNINKDVIISKLPVSSLYFLLPLLSALMYAVSSLSIKRLSKSGNNDQTILFSVMVIMSMLSFPFAIFYWQSINFWQMFIMFLMSILYQLSHYLVIKAYSSAEASFIASFKYSRFPFAIILGYFIGDIIDLNSIIGGLIIVIASYMLLIPSFPIAKKREPSK